jgi:hypothetical protein
VCAGHRGSYVVERAATPRLEAGAVPSTDRRNLAGIERVTTKTSQFLRPCVQSGSAFLQRLTLFFASVSGLWGVLVTDTLQLMITMSGTFAVAYFARPQPEGGGLTGVFARVDPKSLNLLPDFGDWSVALAAFIIPIARQRPSRVVLPIIVVRLGSKGAQSYAQRILQPHHCQIPRLSLSGIVSVDVGHPAFYSSASHRMPVEIPRHKLDHRAAPTPRDEMSRRCAPSILLCPPGPAWVVSRVWWK